MATIRELEEELASLEKRRAVVAKLLEALREYECLDEPLSAVDKKPLRIASAQRLKIRKRSAPIMEATKRLVSQMLNELERPVQTQEVIDRMIESGMAVPSENPANVISARLSNSPEFVGKRGQGWWFADRDWPSEVEDLL